MPSSQKVRSSDESTRRGKASDRLPSKILYIIMCHACFRELLLIRALSSELREIRNSIIMDRLSALVESFVDPVSLLSVMEEMGTIISGSLVFHLLADRSFGVNDIDLYVAEGREDALLDFLLEEGYTEVAYRWVEATQYSQFFVKDVYRVERRKDSAMTKINVILTGTRSPLLAVFDFDFTAVFNAISSRWVMSAYAELTMKGETAVARLPHPLPLRIKKYRDRGVVFLPRLVGSIANADENDRKYFLPARSLKDSHSLWTTLRPGEGGSLAGREVEDINAVVSEYQGRGLTMLHLLKVNSDLKYLGHNGPADCAKDAGWYMTNYVSKEGHKRGDHTRALNKAKGKKGGSAKGCRFK
ncbi:hypothetical protein NP233_g935 [Leucocoprinus birnbaumii]|uniref:Uncharacterized protein n=1 Tax=Leucocoprinus birnbaumii TaxID=56174 RepID=A0AAD5YWB7_9AGAR|nr:hypothetical protein NP233_g935 [Leucocoprinus birnbaumii]